MDLRAARGIRKKNKRARPKYEMTPRLRLAEPIPNEGSQPREGGRDVLAPPDSALGEEVTRQLRRRDDASGGVRGEAFSAYCIRRYLDGWPLEAPRGGEPVPCDEALAAPFPLLEDARQRFDVVDEPAAAAIVTRSRRGPMRTPPPKAARNQQLRLISRNVRGVSGRRPACAQRISRRTDRLLAVGEAAAAAVGRRRRRRGSSRICSLPTRVVQGPRRSCCSDRPTVVSWCS